MKPIESRDTWTFCDLPAMVDSRSQQASFHLYSEKHLRGEFWNMQPGQALSEMTYKGNVLIICLRGKVQMTLETDHVVLSELHQVIVNPDVPFSIRPLEASTVYLVWSPPFAKSQVKPNQGVQGTPAGAGTPDVRRIRNESRR